MTAKYDAALCERLIAWARSFTTDSGTARSALAVAIRDVLDSEMGPPLTALADQLEAARAEIERMRAAVEAVVAWRQTPPLDRPIAEGGSTAPWVRAYRQLEIEIDAYIAAQGAEVACEHRRTERGKDIPRRYGSYRSEVCLDCKAFRARDHHDQLITDSRGGWRPAEQYDSETAESDDE